MLISFDPLDPREVADTVNLLRLLGMIDAAVSVEVNGEPTLTEAEARKQQDLCRRMTAMYRQPQPPQAQQKPAPALPVMNIDIGDL